MTRARTDGRRAAAIENARSERDRVAGGRPHRRDSRQGDGRESAVDAAVADNRTVGASAPATTRRTATAPTPACSPASWGTTSASISSAHRQMTKRMAGLTAHGEGSVAPYELRVDGDTLIATRAFSDCGSRVRAPHRSARLGRSSIRETLTNITTPIARSAGRST